MKNKLVLNDVYNVQNVVRFVLQYLTERKADNVLAGL